ncbi:hypothetical protein LCGC14_0915960 [marine sediment metagenome]|uniref:SCP2 domain-containing protein n=1 Tax=marine sediment metagenome TaxID=412755 RepID=A0A0F9NX13_9ZZZZ
MKEREKENLFITYQQTIDSIILDKRKNPKNRKLLNEFKANINIGLHVEEDFCLWVHLLSENGKYALKRGRMEEYDLEIIATPEDLLYFSNGENSTFNSMFKKNRFGFRKLRFLKGSNGRRNLGLLLKLSKIIVLD